MRGIRRHIRTNRFALMAASWRGISRVDAANSVFMKPGTTATTICVGRGHHPQGRESGQARRSVTVRPAGVVAGSAVVRLAMGGWPLRPI